MNGIIGILESYRADILTLRLRNDLDGIKAKKSELVKKLRLKVNYLSLPKDKIAGINSLIDDIEKADDPDTIIKLINDLIDRIKAYTLDFGNGNGKSM